MAGAATQGSNAIAIGSQAGQTNQAANSIVINASGRFLNAAAYGLYAAPLRSNTIMSDTQTSNCLMFYNTGTNEVFFSTLNQNARAKTFVIDHPVDKDKYLVHACLEGPESGVYYRGESRIFGRSIVIQLPEYVESLAKDFTVHVTPIGEPKMLGASRVEKGQFTVYGPPGEFFWVVYGKRGSIDVEPHKTEVTVAGKGPYKWITSSLRQ